MFYVTYLRRELRRRLRQSVLIAVGLAVGVGLVITVAATSSGVTKAQTAVLSALYGAGTDVTVTGAAPIPANLPGGKAPGGQQIQIGSNGAPEMCDSSGNDCTGVAGKTVDNINPTYLGVSTSKVTEVARLHDVAAAVGGLTLLDQTMTFPTSMNAGGSPPQASSYSIDGVDTAHTTLGPLSAASLASGRSFKADESEAYVAIVDSGYANAHGLKVGSTLDLLQTDYQVIGIVDQPGSSSPPDVYIPLGRAEAVSTQVVGAMTGEVNTIYVTAASAADISSVQKEISALLPKATVTTAGSLAATVTGSLSSTASLANDLGRWLSVLVLIAAFAVASLLTMAAVTRRAREFGTLKALGWRSRRIVAQVLGESVAIGVAGAAAGVGIGFGGIAIIAAVAPKLTATVGDDLGQPSVSGPGQSGGGGAQTIGGGQEQLVGGGNLSHVVDVALSPSVTVGAIVLAVLLAVLGGLVAGAFGSWRIAGLRPADALARVA